MNAAQEAAGRRNWVLRCVSGLLGALRIYGPALTGEDADDVRIAVAALGRIDARRRSVVDTILAALTDEWQTTREVARATSYTPGTVRANLTACERNGWVERTGNGIAKWRKRADLDGFARVGGGE